jgi:hypothetical protein
MPKSRLRKKAAYTPMPRKDGGAAAPRRWIAPAMMTLFVVGLLWIVVYYIAGQDIGVMNSLGNWNLLIGFALIVGGFILSTQWK